VTDGGRHSRACRDLGTQGAEGGNRPLSVSALLAALQV